MTGTDMADPAEDQLPQARSEELTLILRAIDELSRHARNALSLVTVSCGYIALAAFATDTESKLVLPLLNMKVGTSEFFATSPLIIISMYAYLHLLIYELRSRLSAFQELIMRQELAISDPDALIFPWLGTFYYRSRPTPPHLQRVSGGLWHRGFAFLLIWLAAPVLLLSLWLRFVGNEESVSLIPCLSLVASLWIARETYWLPRSRSHSMHLHHRTGVVSTSTLSAALVVITLSSVPELREQSGLGLAWVAATVAASQIYNLNTPSYLIFGVLVLLAPSIFLIAIWLALLAFGSAALIIRLRLRSRWMRAQIDHPIWVTLLLPAASLFIHRFAGTARADLSEMDFSGWDLFGADLRKANLREANLRSTRLIEARLSDAALDGADLGDANLSGADLYAASLNEANLQAANLADSDLGGANLWKADLRGANINNASLFGANLRCAKLEGAMLQRTYLEKADLRGARVKAGQLKHAATLRGAQLDWTT